jgi:hypothetical protein
LQKKHYWEQVDTSDVVLMLHVSWGIDSQMVQLSGGA